MPSSLSGLASFTKDHTLAMRGRDGGPTHTGARPAAASRGRQVRPEQQDEAPAPPQRVARGMQGPCAREAREAHAGAVGRDVHKKRRPAAALPAGWSLRAPLRSRCTCLNAGRRVQSDGLAGLAPQPGAGQNAHSEQPLAAAELAVSGLWHLQHGGILHRRAGTGGEGARRQHGQKRSRMRQVATGQCALQNASDP